MVNLAAGLAARGERVDLVLGRAEGTFLDEVPASVRRVDLGGPRPLAGVAALRRQRGHARPLAAALLSASPPWVLGCLPALAQYLRRERPEALLAASTYANVTALLARREAGVPTRLVVSERNALAARARLATKRRLRVLPAVAQHFYPEADAVAAVSRGVALELCGLAGLDPGRIHVTGNPVVTPALHEAARASPGHAWLAEGAPPVLLAAGKLKPQKDFATLLRAFARLREQRPARLLILGEGPERRRLRALARRLGVARDVAMPGFVRNPFAYMARARVFALSSAFEGLPSVLIQAMACGCPVVSTDCPSGPCEILEQGAHGALVPVGDAPALAAALLRTLASPPSAGALRARAAAFSADGAVTRYLALLRPGSRACVGAGSASSPRKSASRCESTS